MRVTHCASEIPEEQEDAQLLEEQHHRLPLLVFSRKRGFFSPCLYIQQMRHSRSAAESVTTADTNAGGSYAHSQNLHHKIAGFGIYC